MNEFLVVLNKDEDTISIVDLATKTVIKTVPTAHNPHEVVVSADKMKTYISCSLGNVVHVMDNDTFEIIKDITHELFDFPHGLGFSGDGNLYVASTYSNEIFIIDPVKDEIISHFNTGQKHSHMISFSPKGDILYVPNIGSDNITVVDVKTSKIREHISVGKGPEGVAAHPNGQTLYIANQHDNDLWILDTETHEILFKHRIGACPIRVVFSPDAKYALIPNRDSGDLTVILNEQAINGKVRPWEIKRIPVGKWTGGTVFNTNGKMAYVANNKTNDISIIDMGTLKETGRIDVGIHPDGIAFLTK